MLDNEEKFELELKRQNSVRELEQFFVTNKVDNLLEKIDEQKEKIVEEITKFAQDHYKPCKWNKDGEPTKFEIKTNPLVIDNYFFKSIVPITSQEPMYNAEKLGMVFDYYCFILAEVNDKIGQFPSSLTSFCKLAGITMYTLRSYRNSSDINMRVVVEKIYDQIGDTNLTMSQLGMINERTTIFKMKSQNEMIEKEQPKININIVEQPDIERITERLNKYKQFSTKKG